MWGAMMGVAKIAPNYSIKTMMFGGQRGAMAESGV
jgi:hypothetical protein